MKLNALVLTVGVLAVIAGASSSTPAAPRDMAQARAGTLDLGCPSFDNDPDKSFRIRVPKWCGLMGARRQWQIKVQVSIKNTSKKRLDISLRHVALLMTHFNPSRWSPPKIGGPPPFRPYKTKYKGRKVWVVPPNAERAYDNIPPRGNRTFATHWGATSVAPGARFKPKDGVNGAVVFYVPSSRRQRQRQVLDGVVGLAYVDGRDIEAICPPERWGPKVPAQDF